MTTTLYDFNDKHVGETIYIIGTSSTLNHLEEGDIEFLRDKTTIGVNLAYEGINSLTYIISAHISNPVYLFEYAEKDIPMFVAYNGGKKREAFSYMEDFFWSSDRIIVFSSDAPRTPLLKKQNEKDISLSGNTSILLLATHLAYIMGAAKIVYIGFEELNMAHFWNGNQEIEDKMEKNIRDILATKKYWNGRYYNTNPSDSPYNVHKELENWIGGNGYRNFFKLSPEEYNLPVPAHQRNPHIALQNVQNFTRYVNYLNSVNIQTYTLSNEGVAVKAGCLRIKSLTEENNEL